ncbi:hypothetical protein OF83DRAFT_1291579 [Amylostereum chailletii]|nr:hypothetical protein OF83DRAFT_1291579 [Amylostereum chailletii]
MGIRLDLSQLLALFLETLVYGIRVTSYALVVDATDSRNLGAFLTLFIATTSVLSTASTNATHRRQRKFVLPVAAVMLAIATSHLVVDFVRVVEAFIVNINEPGGAVAYYELLSNPLQVAKTVFYVTQTTIGDGMLIWRYYVVYGKKVLITLPLILVLLVNTAAGYVVCWSLSQARPGSTIFHTASSWITTFFVLTMCINVVTTGAIAWRVMASAAFLRSLYHIWWARMDNILRWT